MDAFVVKVTIWEPSGNHNIVKVLSLAKMPLPRFQIKYITVCAIIHIFILDNPLQENDNAFLSNAYWINAVLPVCGWYIISSSLKIPGCWVKILYQDSLVLFVDQFQPLFNHRF